MPELLLKILHTAGIDYCRILAEVLDGDDGPQFGTPAPTSWSQLSNRTILLGGSFSNIFLTFFASEVSL